MTDAALPTLEQPDNDPWIWLEEVDGEKAVAWVDEQCAATKALFSGAGFDKDRDDLAFIMDRPDKLPHITRRGEWIYNYWLDANNPRGIWRRTTLASFKTDTPDWDVVLDLDALAEAEGKDWIWAGSNTLPGAHDIAMLRLSDGGGDATVMREYDIGARTFVAGGFEIAEAKTNLEWLDRDTLLVSSALGDGMATTSGYARTARIWKRGQTFAEAQVIFEVPEDHMACWIGVARTHADAPLEFVDQISFYETDYHIGDATGPKVRIDVPLDSEKDFDGRSLSVKLRTEWLGHAPDTALVIDYAAFLNGSRDFKVLFVPTARHAIQGMAWLRSDTLMVSTLDELKPVQTIWKRKGDDWSSKRIEGLPDIGIAYAWPMDSERSESNGDMLAMVQNPLTPPSLMHIEAGSAPALLKQAPENFDATGLEATQHEAISSDGERIPYFQVGPKGASGDAPVHLTAYGGFGIPMLPGYDSSIGKTWLERGGVAVTACIRGGGEFGTAWHDAGRLAAKKQSHNDFAAVAADLVKRGVTVPRRIAAEGGSNGGLLIANMLTRFPDHFGALFCTIPLIDMRRYTKLLAGASWMAEYGDPEKAEDWAFIKEFSAYQAAQAGQNYPPILIATARKDDRVHPGHARKMTAKLQAMGYDAHLYEPPAGGHGYGKDNSERAAFMALGYAFMRSKIGWE